MRNTKKGDAPVPQPIEDNDEGVASLSYDRPSAIANFHAASSDWQHNSLRLVAAATVVFVVGSVEERSSAKVVADLQASVRERGLKTAQVYRYLGLARALFVLFADTEGGRTTRESRVLQEVEGAKTPEAATSAILAYFEKRKLSSLDKLGVLLGVYKRTPKAAVSEAGEGVHEGNGATPPRVVAALKKLPVAELVEALHAAEADPVEVVDAIAERASKEALRTMLDHLQKRLMELEGVPQNGNAWRAREAQKPEALQ